MTEEKKVEILLSAFMGYSPNSILQQIHSLEQRMAIKHLQAFAGTKIAPKEGK